VAPEAFISPGEPRLWQHRCATASLASTMAVARLVQPVQLMALRLMSLCYPSDDAASRLTSQGICRDGPSCEIFGRHSLTLSLIINSQPNSSSGDVLCNFACRQCVLQVTAASGAVSEISSSADCETYFFPRA